LIRGRRKAVVGSKLDSRPVVRFTKLGAVHDGGEQGWKSAEATPRDLKF